MTLFIRPWILVGCLAIAGCASVELEATRAKACGPGDTKILWSGVTNLRQSLDGRAGLPELSADDFNVGVAAAQDYDFLHGVLAGLPRPVGAGSGRGGIPPVDQPSSVDMQNARIARDQIYTLLSGAPRKTDEFLLDGSALRANVATMNHGDVALLNEISRSLHNGGLEVLIFASSGQYQGSALALAQKNYLEQEIRTANFIVQYFKAYFNNGQILEVSIDTTSLLKDVLSKLENGASPTQIGAIENIIAKFEVDLCPTPGATGACLISRPMGTVKFITRSGEAVGFSGISVTFGENGKLAPTVTHLSSSVVIPQLAQVLLEATFDSVPPFVGSVATSTACQNKLYGGSTDSVCLGASSRADLATQIADVDATATRSQSLAMAGVGYVIRGGYWAALNNEAVAQTVETSAGVIARKVTEKVAWAQRQGDASCVRAALRTGVEAAPGH